VAPSLLAQGQIQPLQRLLHRLMSGETAHSWRAACIDCSACSRSRRA
jgi:hypothetical protein